MELNSKKRLRSDGSSDSELEEKRSQDISERSSYSKINDPPHPPFPKLSAQDNPSLSLKKPKL